MKKYRRAIALFLAIGLMVLIPSGMGVSASGNTVEAKMSENIAQVLSMTGIEREEYSDQQVIIAGNHSNNIRDAAVWAADQVPGYHTAPIKFIGDRTYRGFV